MDANERTVVLRPCQRDTAVSRAFEMAGYEVIYDKPLPVEKNAQIYVGQPKVQHQSDEAWLRADIAALEQLIAMLGEEDALSRLGLQSRLDKQRANLREGYRD